jgi:hypothetical protein
MDTKFDAADNSNIELPSSQSFAESLRCKQQPMIAYSELMSVVFPRVVVSDLKSENVMDRFQRLRIRCFDVQIEDMKTSNLPGPRPMTYTYEGMARL